MTRRIIAIPDIHGELGLLAGLISEIKPTYEDTLVFLGDYVDRGQNTPKTVDFLRMLATQVHCIFLRGNHEDMLLDFVLGTKRYPAGTWEGNGGRTTLMQYGPGGVPFEHLAFLACTWPYFEIGQFRFVHAGFNPDKKIQDQTVHDMLWLREPWLSRGTMPGWDGYIIHGHTVLKDGEQPILGKRINLDAGAYASHKMLAAILTDTNIEIVKVEHQADEPSAAPPTDGGPSIAIAS